MKKILILVFVTILLGFVSNLSATSPIPEEVKPGQKESACVIHITYTDREKEMNGEEASSTLTFDASTSKDEALEKVCRLVSSRLNERHVSEFRIECRFLKQ